jgi:hypothetical protein
MVGLSCLTFTITKYVPIILQNQNIIAVIDTSNFTSFLDDLILISEHRTKEQVKKESGLNFKKQSMFMMGKRRKLFVLLNSQLMIQ